MLNLVIERNQANDIPENKIMEYVIGVCEECKNAISKTVLVKDDLTLTAFRVCVKRKLISADEIKIIDNDYSEVYTINDDGRFNYVNRYPFPLMEDLLLEML
jgi:hypothetical protein